MKRTVTLLFAGLGLHLPANGQTVNLMAGVVQQAVVTSGVGGASCYVARGPVFFQRATTGGRAIMSFAEITGPPYRDLSGQAWLIFSNARTGSINFKFDPAITGVPFDGYRQIYNSAARRLAVSFTIHFTGCDLPIAATFDGV